MKRGISLSLCLSVVLLLVACGGQGAPSASPREGASSPSGTAEVPIGDGSGGPTVSATVPVGSGVSSARNSTLVRLPAPVMEKVTPVVEEVSGGVFISVTAGWGYSCGLRLDRSVECWEWRADLFGHPDRPGWNNDPSDGTPPGGEFVMVDAGWGYACGIRPTGGVECWGWNPVAALEPPVGEFTTVSAGLEHACALRPEGEVECWGVSSRRKGVLVLPDGPFTAIAAGDGRLCGLRPGGEVECWGGFFDELWEPPGGVFESISIDGGWRNMCGLRPDNSVECWRGVLPNEGNVFFSPPGEFSMVSAGRGQYACGLRPFNEVECWHRAEEERAAPAPEEKFTWVSMGHSVACGLPVEGGVLCWNVQTEGRSPWWVREGEFKSLSIGRSHMCGLRVDGGVECWSSWWEKEFEGIPSPDGRFESVSAGDDYSCGLRPSGGVECWGSDEFGKSTPPSGVFTQITTSEDFACGLRPTGEVECWGGRDSMRRQSKVVPPRERLVSVDAGWGGWYNYDDPDSTLRYGERRDWGFSCGLREDGTPLCWGDAISVLGDSSWVLQPPGGEFLNVSMGQRQACGLRPGGSVECWGGIVVVDEEENLFRYEEGSVVYNTDPAAGEDYVDLEVGGWHACGLRSDGGVYCWNWWRGAIDTDYALEGPYVGISAGYNHSCGLRPDGGADCWGLTGEIQRLPEES